MQITNQEAIAKYKIPIVTTPMNEEELERSPYILIRHGLSSFNYDNLVVKDEFGDGSKEWTALQRDESLVDPELHPVGYLQCEAAHPVVNAINFTTVYCSPM